MWGLPWKTRPTEWRRRNKEKTIVTSVSNATFYIKSHGVSHGRPHQPNGEEEYDEKTIATSVSDATFYILRRVVFHGRPYQWNGEEAENDEKTFLTSVSDATFYIIRCGVFRGIKIEKISTILDISDQPVWTENWNLAYLNSTNFSVFHSISATTVIQPFGWGVSHGRPNQPNGEEEKYDEKTIATSVSDATFYILRCGVFHGRSHQSNGEEAENDEKTFLTSVSDATFYIQRRGVFHGRPHIPKGEEE